MVAPHSDLVAAKRAARAAALNARAGADPGMGQALAMLVMARIIFKPGAVIAGFWPMGDEIDIRPLLIQLHGHGHTVALPQTPPRGQPLTFRAWHPGMRMIAERFGTQHPTGDVVTPDILFVPLLAFDRTGRRLGYGGGFYDRTLATLPHARAIGCGYACQEVDEVPAGAYDARLSAIATERELIFVESF